MEETEERWGRVRRLHDHRPELTLEMLIARIEYLERDLRQSQCVIVLLALLLGVLGLVALT